MVVPVVGVTTNYLIFLKRSQRAFLMKNIVANFTSKDEIQVREVGDSGRSRRRSRKREGRRRTRHRRSQAGTFSDLVLTVFGSKLNILGKSISMVTFHCQNSTVVKNVEAVAYSTNGKYAHNILSLNG